MPQMAPVWWLSLFFMFISILFLTSSVGYFNKNNQLLPCDKKIVLNANISWKW